MLVIIKSPPQSSSARRAIDIAVQRLADLILTAEGINHALKGGLDGFCGTAYALQSDLARLDADNLEKGIKSIDQNKYNELLNQKDTINESDIDL
jgi:hypothetical protein